MDHFQQPGARKTDLLAAKAVFLHLLGHQETFGNVDLFVIDVAGEIKNLHTVAQRSGNLVGAVGRGNEHDIAQVEIDLQVVIVKAEVLLRVEHFQQRRAGVAPEIHAELVDFVQHENGIVGAGLFEALDNAAGQCADVGAPVAPYLGLVPESTQ